MKQKKQFSQNKEKINKTHKWMLYIFCFNVVLACIWGPIFISLTLLGPTRHLSQQVIWIAMISYYANMMGNIATAAGLWASITAGKAHKQSVDNAEALEEHIDGRE